MPMCYKYSRPALVHLDTCDMCEYGRGRVCRYTVKKKCNRCKKDLHESEKTFGVCDECCETIYKLKNNIQS